MPTLTVLDGEAICTRPAVAGELVLLRERTVAPDFQLGLPGVGPSRASLIATSLRSLAGGHELRTRLFELDVRVIVDVRIAPEFFSIGSSLSKFVELVTSLGMSFLHYQRLANRQAGYTSNPEVMRQRYEADLEQQLNVLRELRDLIDVGPVLLLGPERAKTDRDVLVAALQRVRTGFEVIRLEE